MNTDNINMNTDTTTVLIIGLYTTQGFSFCPNLTWIKPGHGGNLGALFRLVIKKPYELGSQDAAVYPLALSFSRYTRHPRLYIL